MKQKSRNEDKLDHPILAEHADAIRSLGKRVIADVIEIGRRLTDAKQLAGHGNWIPWLDREFGWTEQTALNFIRVYELAESKNFLDLSLPVSGLYLLAAPSTSAEARDEIIERAAGGEKVTTAQVKATIGKGKSRKPPTKRQSRKTSQQAPAPPIAEPEPPDKTVSETPATPERHEPEATTPPPPNQVDEPPAPALGPPVGPAVTETHAAPLSDRNATEVAEAPSIVGETVTVELIDDEARRRRRRGTRQVKVTLEPSEIEALIRMGRLEAEERDDPQGLQVAVMSLIYAVLEDPTCFAMLTLRRGRRSP
jgi:hypothetical protein